MTATPVFKSSRKENKVIDQMCTGNKDNTNFTFITITKTMKDAIIVNQNSSISNQNYFPILFSNKKMK